MVIESRPSFEEFVRPLRTPGGAPPAPSSTLSDLPIGEYAVLAWLDELQARYPAEAEADLIADWHATSLHDVYAMLFPDAEQPAR
ncbi:MAG: hypothetical protein ACJ74U_20460 [Jatrophihabitantaceae bacterium]